MQSEYSRAEHRDRLAKRQYVTTSRRSGCNGSCTSLTGLCLQAWTGRDSMAELVQAQGLTGAPHYLGVAVTR